MRPCLSCGSTWCSMTSPTPEELQELLRRATFLVETDGTEVGDSNIGVQLHGYRTGLVSILKFVTGGLEIRCAPEPGRHRAGVYWKRDPLSDKVDYYDESLVIPALNELRKCMVLDDLADA